MTRKVTLKDQLGRVVRIPAERPPGATVGRDLRWPNGRVVTEAELRQPARPGSSAAATLWRLIREVPENLLQLAALAGMEDGDVIAWDGEDGRWRARAMPAGGGFAPYYLPAGEVFHVPLNQQALFSMPITLGDGAALVIEGALVEVH